MVRGYRSILSLRARKILNSLSQPICALRDRLTDVDRKPIPSMGMFEPGKGGVEASSMAEFRDVNGNQIAETLSKLALCLFLSCTTLAGNQAMRAGAVSLRCRGISWYHRAVASSDDQAHQRHRGMRVLAKPQRRQLNIGLFGGTICS